MGPCPKKLGKKLTIYIGGQTIKRNEENITRSIDHGGKEGRGNRRENERKNGNSELGRHGELGGPGVEWLVF